MTSNELGRSPSARNRAARSPAQEYPESPAVLQSQPPARPLADPFRRRSTSGSTRATRGLGLAAWDSAVRQSRYGRREGVRIDGLSDMRGVARSERFHVVFVARERGERERRHVRADR